MSSTVENSEADSCNSENECDKEFKTHRWKPEEFIKKYGSLVRPSSTTPEDICRHIGNITPIICNNQVIEIREEDLLYLDNVFIERNAITIQRAFRKYYNKRQNRVKTASQSSTGSRVIFRNGEMIYVDDEFEENEDETDAEKEKLRMKEASKKILTHYTRRHPNSEDNSDIFPTGSSVSDERLLQGATDAVKSRRSKNQNNLTTNHENTTNEVTMRQSYTSKTGTDSVTGVTECSSSTYSSLDDQDRDSIKTHESYESCHSDVFAPDGRSSPTLDEIDTSAPRINPEKVKFLYTENVPRPIIKRRKERSRSVTDLFRGVADNENELLCRPSKEKPRKSSARVGVRRVVAPLQQEPPPDITITKVYSASTSNLLDLTTNSLEEEEKTPNHSLESLDDIDEGHTGTSEKHHRLKRKKSMKTLLSTSKLHFKNQYRSIRKKHSGQIQKTTFNPYSALSKPAGKIFGAALSDQVEQDGDVPEVLAKLIDAIEQDPDGLGTHGIYRIGGSVPIVNKLKELIEEDVTAVEFDEFALTVLTSTLKSFFHDLPETLLTDDLYDEFLTTADAESEQHAFCLKLMANKLPATNRNTLDLLLTHLAKICSKMEKNSMGPNNVAICFAPNLTKRNLDFKLISDHNGKLIKILTVLIEDRLEQLVQSGEIQIEVGPEITELMEELLQKIENMEITEKTDDINDEEDMSPKTISAILLASKAMLDNYENMFKTKRADSLLFDFGDFSYEDEAVTNTSGHDIARDLLDEILEVIDQKYRSCDSIDKDVDDNNDGGLKLSNSSVSVEIDSSLDCVSSVRLSTSSGQSISQYEDADSVDDNSNCVTGYEGPLITDHPESLPEVTNINTSDLNSSIVNNNTENEEGKLDNKNPDANRSIDSECSQTKEDILVSLELSSEEEDNFLDCSDDKMCLLKS